MGSRFLNFRLTIVAMIRSERTRKSAYQLRYQCFIFADAGQYSDARMGHTGGDKHAIACDARRPVCWRTSVNVSITSQLVTVAMGDRQPTEQAARREKHLFDITRSHHLIALLLSEKVLHFGWLIAMNTQKPQRKKGCCVVYTHSCFQCFCK